MAMKGLAPLGRVVEAASPPSGKSYNGSARARSRRAAAPARTARTMGAVSIRQAEAASAIGSIEPVSWVAHAPTRSVAWPTA